jgi:large subunit ribosomal protein L4
MKSVSVLDMKGKVAGKVSLDGDYFDSKVKKSLLHQAVLMYLADLRKGSSATKRRAEVRGGGRKPWRQKGTGRARVGSIRSPLWKGGGVVFGPHPRNYSYRLPKKITSLALQHSLNAKIRDNEFLVTEKIAQDKPKTSEFASFLQALKAEDKPLVVIEAHNALIHRAARNIPGVTVKVFSDINAYDVLKHKKVIFSKQALEKLVKLRGK